MQKLKEIIEKEIEEISNQGIDESNLDVIYKMVDIHKDIIEEEKNIMKMEEINMRYNGNYSRGNYGRNYNDGSYGTYGRRSYGTHPAIDRMGEMYGAYREASEEANRGNYGAKNEKMEKLEIMLDSCLEFWESIVRENTDPESVEMIRHYMSKMQDM